MHNCDYKLFIENKHTKGKQNSSRTNPKFNGTILKIRGYGLENESIVTMMASESRDFLCFFKMERFDPDFWHFGLEIA